MSPVLNAYYLGMLGFSRMTLACYYLLLGAVVTAGFNDAIIILLELSLGYLILLNLLIRFFNFLFIITYCFK